MGFNALCHVNLHMDWWQSNVMKTQIINANLDLPQNFSEACKYISSFETTNSSVIPAGTRKCGQKRLI